MKKMLVLGAATAAAMVALPSAASAGVYERDGYYGRGYDRDYRDGYYGRGERYRDRRRYRRGDYYRGRGYSYGYGYGYPAYGYGYDRGYYGRGYRCDDGTTGAIVGGAAGALIGRSIDRNSGRRQGYRDGTGGAIIGGVLGALVGSSASRC